MKLPARACDPANEPAPRVRSEPIMAASAFPSGGRRKRRSRRVSLPAVVATASLELGIDMGAVDLVCQVESPGSVARGFSGWAGRGTWCGASSKGRLIAKTPGDLLESAALCRAMLEGEIEPLRVPHNCLDVLAQQVIACVAMEPWDVPALFDLVAVGLSVPRTCRPSVRERPAAGLRPVPDARSSATCALASSWDRIHNRLSALPGTAQLALVGRRHDSRHGSVSRVPWGGGAAAGRARRGVRLRAAGRRDVRAGQFHLADRGDRAASRRGRARRRARRR